VAEELYRVELTASFLERLDAIEAFLTEADAAFAFDNLLAELRATELTILVDQYESNEPVLGARLEVESGTVKATASFRAEQGDYVVTDATLLKALNAPGDPELQAIEQDLKFLLASWFDIGFLQLRQLDWNTPAIEFYESIGAIVMPDWRICRITGEALDRLAAAATAS